MKFYLHDSATIKTSEYFGRIKELIILKIQKSFDGPIYLSDSIISNQKKTFTKPKKSMSTLGDSAELALKQNVFGGLED